MRNRSLIFDQLWAASADGPSWIFDRGSDAVRTYDGEVSLREIAKAAYQDLRMGRCRIRPLIWSVTEVIVAPSAMTGGGSSGEWALESCATFRFLVSGWDC